MNLPIWIKLIFLSVFTFSFLLLLCKKNNSCMKIIRIPRRFSGLSTIRGKIMFKTIVTPETSNVISVTTSNTAGHLARTTLIATNTTLMAEFQKQRNGKDSTTSDLRVPNVIHFTWFFPEKIQFQFLHLTSILSTFYKHGPNVVYFWHDVLPNGEWWKYLTELVSKHSYPFVLKQISPPDEIFGRKIQYGAHKSDIFRINVLNQYGGVYLDLDVIVLKPLYPLMKNELTMGKTTEENLSNGIMFSAPKPRFFTLWLDNYKKHYNPKQWATHSVRAAMKLWRENPKLVHVENKSLTHPSWKANEIKYMFQPGLWYDWEENFTMHIWDRYYSTKQFSPETIKSMNTTAGQVFRWIWYNTTQLIY